MISPSQISPIRARANRGFSHVFLKNPLAQTPDATTVEAGNIFSPGAWSCGIGPIWRAQDGWKTPDDLPLETVFWRFEDGENGGIAPVLESKWRADEVEFHSRLTHIGGEGASGVDYATLQIHAPNDAEFGVLVRDIGPAGGQISGLGWDENGATLQIEGGAKIVFQTSPIRAQIFEKDADFDSPCALFLWEGNGAKTEISFRVEHGFGARSLGNLAAPAPHGPPRVEEGFARAILEWKTAVPTQICALVNAGELPDSPRFEAAKNGSDARISRVWELACHHLLAASEAGTARIGAINYPHLWLRDGVLVARAFDLMGRADLARVACEEIAPQIFAGGFGAESDAPGQGIWALVSHAKHTGDWGWLELQWPHILARLSWIEKMISTDKPLRAVGSGRIPFYLETPAINVVCNAAKNGVISGRMDWHAPDFFINCWSVRGLRDGAFAANLRGDQAGFNRWNELADELEHAVFEHLLPHYGNPRDPIITPYPSETLTDSEFLPALRERFTLWFRTHRLDENGARKREELWTYFEVAQIHNAFRLGLVEEAWTALDALLDDEIELGAWREGWAGGNENLPFGNGNGRRGWLDEKTAQAGNMPHGWTCAEIVNLLHFLGADEKSVYKLGKNV